MAAHVAAIVVMSALILSGGTVWWLALPVQGILLIFLFTLEHEATHKTPFANAALNEWVGRVCGVILILPFTWFRYFHLAHHRFTNDPGRDPELLAGAKPTGWAEYVWHVTGLPYWFGMLCQLGTLTLGRGIAEYVPANARRRVVAEARVLIVLYAVVFASFFWSPLLIWLWLVPILIGQPFLRLYLLAEHGRCAFVGDMFVNTRTTLTNRFVRWLAWNMPYHSEHHAMPNVPFHRLPELHDLSRGHLKEVEAGYADFHRKFAPDMASGKGVN